MVDDYRRTKYCPIVVDIKKNKQKVVNTIKSDHRKAINMYNYISKENDCYKSLFAKAYNGKCCYCGVSIELIPLELFEIDHFVCKTSKSFKNKSEANEIDNLVFSCKKCNRGKTALDVSPEKCQKLNPDGDEITKTFIRDNSYYIKVADELSEDKEINEFYNSLGLGEELKRIDFLLMNMIGLYKKYKDSMKNLEPLLEAIELLKAKRNVHFEKKSLQKSCV